MLGRPRKHKPGAADEVFGRHNTAVNQLYRATKDILLTQRFARHSSLLVTSAYLHPTDEDLARSVQKIRC